jgi:sec-independent protein translocase protein TatA
MTGFIILSMPGGLEWVLLFAVVLLLFGGKKIPELMRGLGQGVREFKKASKVEDDKTENIEKSITDGK